MLSNSHYLKALVKESYNSELQANDISGSRAAICCTRRGKEALPSYHLSANTQKTLDLKGAILFPQKQNKQKKTNQKTKIPKPNIIDREAGGQ